MTNKIKESNITDGAVTSAKLATDIDVSTTGTVTTTGLITGSLTKTGDLTVDVSGNIRLDADDAGEVRLLDGGTQYAALKNDDSRLKIQSIISDKDILIVGNDGGVETTAVAIDMSEGGRSRFYGGVSLGGDGAANTLDDYEEGTFTPIFRPLGGAESTITYSTQTGHYTKIGRMVYFQIYLIASSVSLGAGNTQLVLGGLPFSASPNWGFCSIGIEGGFTSTDAPQTGRVEGSIVILQTNASSDARANIGAYVAATTLQNNSSIICGGCYITNV